MFCFLYYRIDVCIYVQAEKVIVLYTKTLSNRFDYQGSSSGANIFSILQLYLTKTKPQLTLIVIYEDTAAL